jgi:AcrR family transcriptional regulator
MNDQPGLRERKKLATREALRLAALRLAVEKGWEQVRVEDIAAEAGVSPRTFNNYFASKDEAFLATAYDRGARMQAALAARPADEPLWPAVINAVVHGFADEAVDLRQARRIRPTPALAAEQLKAIMVIERALADEIDPADRRRPRARPLPAAGGRRRDQRHPGDRRALAAQRVRPALPAGAARGLGARGRRPSPAR